MAKPTLSSKPAATPNSYVKFSELRAGQFFRFHKSWKPIWATEGTLMRKTGKDRAETYTGTSWILQMMHHDRKVIIVTNPNA